MSRLLATIQKIDKLEIHPNADKLEIATIKGWKVIVEKDTFKENELVVYFEVDSLMPIDNTAFEFLSKGTKEKTMTIEDRTYKGYRLKTIKLRGQLSQGLVLPAETIILKTKENKMFNITDSYGGETRVQFDETDIGADVSETLGIVKYEQPLPANLSGKVKGFFPNFIPKTDEERVQNIGEVIERHQKENFYVTEKIDGSSMTVYKSKGELGVCSRNLEFLDTEGNTLWEMVRKYNLEENLPEGFAIQGELIGEGIQKNPLKRKGHELYVYSVYDIAEQKYLDYEEFIRFCENLNIQTVPILYANYQLIGKVEDLLELANGYSLLANTCKREGLVFRPLKEATEMINGSVARFSFKAISNSYLLKEQ